MPHISSPPGARASYYGAQRTAPRDSRACARQHRDAAHWVPCGFTHTFGQARFTHAGGSGVASSRPSPPGNASSSGHRVWPAALALLLVSNLAAPVVGAVPRRGLIADSHDDNLSPPAQLPAEHTAAYLAEVFNASAPTPDEVDIRPVERVYFKRDYTLMDLLRAVAASRAPFEKYGDSVGDAYDVFSERQAAPDAREKVRSAGRVVDTATGLLPRVALLRVPGDLAQFAVNELEGKPFELRDYFKVLEYLNPKTHNSDATSATDTPEPSTGQWQAGDPLKPGGGGYGRSHGALHSGSIEEEWPDVARAISHLPNEDTQAVIQTAFGNLASLRLQHANRADCRLSRDDSIVGHRMALQDAMRHVDREAPLLLQQREAAAATAMFYSDNPLAEIFCRENAEILFHLLLEGGIPDTCLRMITVHPRNRSPHVMVLYTTSETFIRMLHLATPVLPTHGQHDGIDERVFERAIFLTRDSTLLLDPWGATKATGFSNATTDHEVRNTLDGLFANMGHGDGQAFTVSITRALSARTHDSGSSRSVGSPMSSASAESRSNADEPSVAPDDWSPSTDNPANAP